MLGEGSPFHETFGYYADGVEEQTALLPRNWKDRLIPIVNDNTRGVVGLCLDIHDLLISKYCAGREKDLEFTREVVKRGMVERELLVERLEMMDLSVEQRSLVQFRIDRNFS